MVSLGEQKFSGGVKLLPPRHLDVRDLGCSPMRLWDIPEPGSVGLRETLEGKLPFLPSIHLFTHQLLEHQLFEDHCTIW